MHEFTLQFLTDLRRDLIVIYIIARIFTKSNSITSANYQLVDS